uniref:Uncharacterized protein n=1 Tax=Panagrolaimus sp. PS1159 TaxID=55785 RepID=A0AC35GP74_9BILA
MLVVVIFMLLFVGCLNADIPAECGYATGSETEGCVRAKTSTGIEFAYKVHDELLVWVNPEIPLAWVYMCYDASDSSCINEYGYRKDFVYVYSIAVLEQKFIPDYVLPIDVTALNYPSFWYYYNNQRNLRVALNPGKINSYTTFKYLTDESYVYFTDEEDKCRSYRPTALKLDNFLNMDLYMNQKHARYSYFFIKKGSFICAYAFEHQDLFKNNGLRLPEAKPVKFRLIENYPTENYAPSFFAIDPLYGTFVSLYWDGHSVPEAHFYAIDEDNLSNIPLVDKIKLTQFHDGCLKAIFENNFGAFEIGQVPAFQSYGRQVFVSYKFEESRYLPPFVEKYIWNGLWKNENEFNVPVREIKYDYTLFRFNKDRNDLFWVKKSWIQKDKPAIPYTKSAPTTFSPKTTPVPTTLAPTTAPAPTEPPSLSTTLPPSKQTSPLTSTTDLLSSSSIPITTTTTSNNSGATIDNANSTRARSTPSINDALQTNVAALVQDASSSVHHQFQLQQQQQQQLQIILEPQLMMQILLVHVQRLP